MRYREAFAALVLAATGSAWAAPVKCEQPQGYLPEIAAKATVWAEARSREVLEKGIPMTEELQAVARRVGVKHPDRIRVLVVGEIRLSEDPHLKAAGASVGLEPTTADGLTLGYAMVIRRGAERDMELIRHEMRHVAQYEACGGIAGFLKAHIGHLVERGYRESPFEIDARAHER